VTNRVFKTRVTEECRVRGSQDMLRSRVTFCLLASYLLMRAGDAQTLPSLPTSAANWDEFKTALSAKTEEDQNRMWCQCSTDG